MLLPAIAGLVVGLSSVDRYPRQRVDVIDYQFAIELTDRSNVIAGRARIDVKLLEPRPAEIWFDLIGRTADTTGMEVVAVRLGDRSPAFRHRDGRLVITLPDSLATPRRLTVEVEYRGIPATGLLIGTNRHGQRTFFSDNWPDKARHWLPVVDHISDKATSTFAVTAPSHYQVISNGAEIERSDLPGNTRLTVWRQSIPIAPWLFALGVAQFAIQHVGVHQGIPVSTWVMAPEREAGFHDFAVPTLEALAFYSERIGPYAYEKLANVQSNSVAGGMEAASSIFYAAGSVTGTRPVRWRNVIIHEVAHQWWGNSVTERDWDDVWLSEGFATYFTLLFIEHAFGRDEFVEGLRRSRETILAFDRGNPDYRIVHDQLADMSKVTTRQTYEKGAWTLHMLRNLIGTDTFWRGIREYYREHRDAQASTAEFRAVMERVSGQSLGWFFDQWLLRGGSPAISGTWSYDRGRGAVTVTLNQSQPGAPFRLPLTVAAKLPDGTVALDQVVLVEREHRFSFPVAAEPVAVELDPAVSALFSTAGLVRR